MLGTAVKATMRSFCLERVLYMSNDHQAWGDVRYHLANDVKVDEGVVDGCC